MKTLSFILFTTGLLLACGAETQESTSLFLAQGLAGAVFMLVGGLTYVDGVTND